MVLDPVNDDATAQLQRLLRIMAKLRDPEGGCPWDLAQDFSTIAPYTIEEAYEVADAIDRGDMDALREELGDLLLQVVFHAQMAREAGAFAFADVAGAISDKMERRHPHVFGHGHGVGDGDGVAADAVRADWEAIKRAERAAAGESDASALAGIARGLPEWQRAVKLQDRAARVGFDWPGPEPVMAKLEEELAEVRAEFAALAAAEAAAANAAPGPAHDAATATAGPAGTAEAASVVAARDRLEAELGDLLFVAANLARHAKVDPGAALRRANHTFERRFRAMEAMAAADGTTLQGLALDAHDAYWTRVKHAERDAGG